MADMLDFVTALLSRIADFLLMEPIIYIVASVLLLITVTIILRIVRASRA